MRLLLVDDHLMFRAGSIQILRRIVPDVEFGETSGAREGLNLVVEGKWDLSEGRECDSRGAAFFETGKERRGAAAFGPEVLRQQTPKSWFR